MTVQIVERRWRSKFKIQEQLDILENQRRMMEGVNSAMIYCKNFCNYHNVPLAQQ
jgi:hypothetical protein